MAHSGDVAGEIQVVVSALCIREFWMQVETLPEEVTKTMHAPPQVNLLIDCSLRYYKYWLMHALHKR
jgi:hypothetical protein